MDPVAHCNRDRMLALTPATDIDGHEIKVGSRVRCFDDTRYDPDHDALIVNDRSYFEGVITEIVKYTPLGWHEGMYYVVDMLLSVTPKIERTRNDYTVGETLQTLYVRGPIHVLANGHEFADGTRSFGVVRLL